MIVDIWSNTGVLQFFLYFVMLVSLLFPFVIFVSKWLHVFNIGLPRYFAALLVAITIQKGLVLIFWGVNADLGPLFFAPLSAIGYVYILGTSYKGGFLISILQAVLTPIILIASVAVIEQDLVSHLCGDNYLFKCVDG